jgi:esterase/lipase superfamily enzyme
LLLPDTAFAQVPKTLLNDPSELVLSLSRVIQSGEQKRLYQWFGSELLRSLMTENIYLGIDPAIMVLGSPSTAKISSISHTPEGTVLAVRVVHERGSANWRLVINPITERIEATFMTSDSAIARPDRDHTNFAPTPSTREFGRDPQVLSAGPSLVDPRVVEFLYATTRKQQDFDRTNVTFTGDRDPQLVLGAASIRIPEDHKIGRIELPTPSWRLWSISEQTSDERRQFTVRKVTRLTPEQWGDVVRAKAHNRALIFVHGYNNSFQDALFRNAQIVWDMQYPGLSVLFSWASKGQAADYFYDRESAYIARNAFIRVLKMLKEDYGIDRVDVLAHSMGNVVVLDALAHHAQTGNPAKIGELIMAAPDVDRDGFIGLMPGIGTIAAGLTLYASSADRALAASRIPTGVPRAGDVPAEGPVVLPGMETIDVTAIGSDLLGMNHDVFASNRAVMDDLKLVLATGMRPPSSRLSQIRGFPERPLPPKYWRYAP